MSRLPYSSQLLPCRSCLPCCLSPPVSLPPSIASFMSAPGHHWLRCNGSAVEFTYEGGRLTRTDIDSGDCGWQVSGGGAAHTAEVWYSSGGYTRCPVSLQAELAAGRAVTLEAGAIIYRSADGPCLVCMQLCARILELEPLTRMCVLLTNRFGRISN
jgi:hypothetical protein